MEFGTLLAGNIGAVIGAAIMTVVCRIIYKLDKRTEPIEPNSETEETKQEYKEKDYPAGHEALNLSIKAMDWSLQRAENKDRNISTIMTITFAVAVGLIALIYRQGTPIEDYVHLLVVDGFIFALISFVIGWRGLTKGFFEIPMPSDIFRDHIESQPKVFSGHMTYYLGEMMERNKKVVEAKADAIMLMFLFIALMASAFVAAVILSSA